MKFKKLIVWVLLIMMTANLGLMAHAEGRIWQKGDTGEEVRQMQERLRELEYLDKEPDGIFDEQTEAALTAFQRVNGLMVTGMADSLTWNLLFSVGALPAENDPYDVFVEMDAVPASTAYPLTGMIFSKSSGASVPYFAASEPMNTNEFSFFAENGFQSASLSPLSTFAADVDTASYALLRSLILSGQNVPEDAVRVEEMLNYFHYDYNAPKNGSPLGVSMELAACPWNPDTLLLQIGLQASVISSENRPRHNLVFLIDVSGSMYGSDRLDLVKRAFLLMLDALDAGDTVSIVTYASREEVVLSGASAADKVRIMEAISDLSAAGSTNSSAGIQTAYEIAAQYADENSVNRIIMATDGDFNVGITSEGDLARLVMEKKKSGISLTMLGVGYGNYKDNKLEALADYGDGNYYYLDSIFEARRALVAEAGSTLIEVARDVKLQVDFNPAKVSAYRLIGYEDRLMMPEDFADDTKDGGEIGSGHRVTALYEIVPVGSAFQPASPKSRYQTASDPVSDSEWLTLNIRFKKPGQDESELEVYPLAGDAAETLSDNMAFAAAVAETAMLLRDSEFKGTSSYASALELARSCSSVQGDPYKEEFVYLLTLLEREQSLR